MNLLIVNDVDLTLRFLRDGIPWDTLGFAEIFTASNADEAKEVFLDNEVDIILCDIEMPGENGIELIRWVTSHHYPTDTIFLTCHANFDYIQDALHLDCQDYILYPQPPAKIMEAVRTVIARRQEREKERQLAEYGRQWLDMHQQSIREEGETSQSIVDATVSYILQNLSSPDLSVNEIAEAHHISLSYLSRLFKKNKEVTLSHYIISERMKLAASLLESSPSPITIIALEVGYSSYPYFTSAFKKYYGITPSEYRDLHAVNS